MTQESRQKAMEKWHLDPRISLGHIISTLLLLGGMVMGAISFSNRMAVNEVTTKHNAQAIRDMREDQNKQYAEIIRRLERLDR